MSARGKDDAKGSGGPEVNGKAAGGKGRGPGGPKNTKKIILRLLKYLAPYRLQLIVVVALLFVSSGAQIAGNYFLKPLINDYIIPFIGSKNPPLGAFLLVLGKMCIVYAIGVVATLIYMRMMVKISTTTLYRIRTDLFDHMQNLPVAYFDTHTHGELMSRFTNDTDVLREMLGQSLIQLISSVVMIVGVFIAMLLLSPLLTLVTVAMLVVMLVVVTFLAKKTGYYFMKQQQSVGKVNGFIEEMIEGQKVIKVFNHEDAAKAGFETLNDELSASALGAQTFAGLLMPIMMNLSYFTYALIAMVGAVVSIARGLDIGTLASFLQYSRNFSQPITQVSQQFNSIMQALAGAERIFQVLDEPAEADDGYVSLVNARIDAQGNVTEEAKQTGVWMWKHPHGDGTLTYTQLRGDVRFIDTSFAYVPEKPVLRDISLYAKPGQMIAFVGSTGAGKTTITNLLNRFYDVPDGKIRYDGINIRKIKKADLRRSLGMVLQDAHLFTGTVAENIRFGKLDATDDDVVAAAKLASAHYFISHLPQGYDTVLTNDGANLSQGQRQLLSIARAAVANPPVLVLDEATSSVDTRTEALIARGMNQLMEGRTVFVIAHRLSTIRMAKAIMVLENGSIIERGDHDELIDMQGRYYQLYTGMFELS